MLRRRERKNGKKEKKDEDDEERKGESYITADVGTAIQLLYLILLRVGRLWME